MKAKSKKGKKELNKKQGQAELKVELNPLAGVAEVKPAEDVMHVRYPLDPKGEKKEHKK